MKYNIFIIFTALLLNACGNPSTAGGTGVGNPSKEAVATEISVKAEIGAVRDSSDPFVPTLADTLSVRAKKVPSVDQNSESVSYRVDQMLMRVDSISWEVDIDDDFDDYDPRLHYDEDEIVFAGPWTFNLSTGFTLDGAKLEIPLPQGHYKAIHFYLNPAGRPSIEMLGSVSDSAGAVPFRIELPYTLEFEFESSSPVLFDSVNSKSMKLIFDPQIWLQDVNVKEFGVMKGDTLVINETDVNFGKEMHTVRKNIVKSSVLKVH